MPHQARSSYGVWRIWGANAAALHIPCACRRRSLRAFHHYVPIFKTSEHDLMPRIEWAFQHEDLSRHIVHNANRFALTYTTYKARVRGLAVPGLPAAAAGGAL